MDQISRPLLVALVAVVGFAGVWMLVLRPRASGGGDSAAAPAVAAAVPAPKAPGQAGLERSVDRARGAVAASEASAARTQSAVAAAGEGETPSVAQPPAATAPKPPVTRPAPAPADVVAPPKPAVAPAPSPAPRVTLLLFTGGGADDAVAREVVRSIHAPGVKTIVAPIARVSDYSDLVGSVEIPGTPTILVIGTDRRAQRIVGLPDEAQVRQALAAAR